MSERFRHRSRGHVNSLLPVALHPNFASTSDESTSILEKPVNACGRLSDDSVFRTEILVEAWGHLSC